MTQKMLEFYHFTQKYFDTFLTSLLIYSQFNTFQSTLSMILVHNIQTTL